MKLVAGILIVMVIVSACSARQNSSNNTLKSEIEQNSKEYQTKTGKVFVVLVDHSQGASICDVKITTKGFTASNLIYDLGTVDKIDTVFLADLDQNGFEELYIVSQSVGSGSYSNIYGMASNKDKSATSIYVPPISELHMEKGGFFEGFMGHNQFTVERGKLFNEYLVYLEDDSNSNPNGGKRKVLYGLIAGEAGWILNPERIILE